MYLLGHDAIVITTIEIYWIAQEMSPQLNINILRHISATITVTCSTSLALYVNMAALLRDLRGKRFIGLTVTSAQFSSLFHTVIVSSRVTVSLRLGRCAHSWAK